ncbi:hypothetical protein [Kineococcus terrestris]|uniref:hypothetical protein n=1 Tax=Kineococcus terrestris TaxID=2044856 RepID=UPI0034DAF794
MTQLPQLRDLILSVGTHRSARPLSPSEVADAIVAWSNELGMQECLQRISLGESTARKFLKLRELEKDIAAMVDWGREPGAIGFAAAAEITRLKPSSERRALAQAAVEKGLTKEEVRQVVQLRLRSGMSLDDAVLGALKMRPTVERINVFIGGVSESVANERLSDMSQRDRNALLRSLLDRLGYSQYSGRLTPSSFTLVGEDPVSPDQAAKVEESLNSVQNWPLS